jgi:hypothetical protein
MRHRVMWLACVLLLLPIVACQEDTPLSPPVDQQASLQPYANPEQIAATIMASTGWPAFDEEGNSIELQSPRSDAAGKCQVQIFDRQMITSEIAHYHFQVRVGPGPHDFIGIHRVVKERRPGCPIRTAKSVFMSQAHS